MDNTTPTIPRISVVMPLYNKEKEVARAIDAVLAQTVKEFELIVVNDGSTDKGPDHVRALSDERIRLIEQPNAGVSAARNRGIEAAQADLIAFLDADDEWKPDFLETVIQLRSRFPACSVFATNYLFSLPDGTSHPTILKGIPKEFDEGILTDYFAVAANSDPPLWSSAVAVTKKAITSIGGFPVGIAAGEDLLTWARLAVKSMIAYSIKPRAVFWMPMQLSDRPGRVPQEPDLVGMELKNLMTETGSNRRDSLRIYIAFWHRMRANIFLQTGSRRSALKEIRQAISYAGLSTQLLIYECLSLLPSTIGTTLFLLMQNIRRWMRNLSLIKEASRGKA